MRMTFGRTSVAAATVAIFGPWCFGTISYADGAPNCPSASVPSPLLGRQEIDLDRSWAEAAYFISLIQHATDSRDCSACPSDRYTWADFVREKLGDKFDPANLTTVEFKALSALYTVGAPDRSQTVRVLENATKQAESAYWAVCRTK